MKEVNEAIKKTAVITKEYKQLRADFNKLLIKNPNYFGNLKGTKFKSQLNIVQEKSFEEVACIGYNPQQELLYAIIKIKQNYGYNGNLCTSGSNEYVRFFVDWNGDGNFSDPNSDIGFASVNVHDIPGAKPLCYCVSINLDSKKLSCITPQLLKVRAILSWNAIPTPGNCDFDPSWGDVIESTIQIKPSAFKLGEFISHSGLSSDKSLISNLNLDLDISKKSKYSYDQLKNLYKDMKVEEHRLNVQTVSSYITKAAKDAHMLAEGIPPYKNEIPEIIKNGVVAGLASSGNISYEELNSVGLQYNNDIISAVVTVKRPYGYNGSLCTAGSQEYITFWADFNNDGDFEEYLGVAAINVHDISSVPPEGLKYAVSLPVNLSSKKNLCTSPQIFKIRAILSWEVSPPTNPNYTPIWGNVVDSLIQIKPGTPVEEGARIPFISTVGNMAVTDINASGLANGIGVNAIFQAIDSPFGGYINIAGHISNPPNLSTSEPNLKYQILYRKVGDSTWTKITNKFQITISQWDGSDWSQYHMNQFTDADGCYQYMEDLKVVPPIDLTQNFVEGFVLGKWYTGGLQDGLYEIKLVLKNTNGLVDSNIVRVMLDNKAPDVDLKVTEFELNGIVTPADSCQSFKVNSIIRGKFSVTDDNFGSYKFAVEPDILKPNKVNPETENYPVLGAYNKTWELNTNGMEPCGYVIHLHAYDRTIVNSGSIGWYNGITKGFCIIK